MNESNLSQIWGETHAVVMKSCVANHPDMSLKGVCNIELESIVLTARSLFHGKVLPMEIYKEIETQAAQAIGALVHFDNNNQASWKLFDQPLGQMRRAVANFKYPSRVAAAQSTFLGETNG